jgi:L-iditol 2-dehydrogenase
MKKAYLTGVRKVEVREVPDPAVAAPDDVLIRLSAVGVCGSDLHYYREGRIGEQVVEFPFAVGHECAGVVEQAGPAARSPGNSKGKMPSPLLPGTRVAIDPLVACGRCDQCLAGRPNTCREQKFLGCPGQLEGATAQRLLMPARCVYPIPDGMTFEQAVMAEPFAIALWAVRLAGSVAGKRVAVLGCGPIGLCVIQALRSAGDCTILATDILEPRVALAGRTGADWAGNASQLDAAAAILQQAPRGVDLVFECAGMQETIDQAGKVLTPGGRLVLLGIPAGDRLSFDMNDYRRKELSVQNVRRQNSCAREALELIAAGKVRLEEQVTHHFSLEESQAAFDLVADYRDGVVKAIIHP